MTFEPLMGFKENLMKIGNFTEAATFKSFLHQSYENTQLFFFCDSAF